MPPSKSIVVPNALLRQSLFSIERVVGPIGLNAVLRKSGMERFLMNLPPEDLAPSVSSADYARLNQVVEDLYGRASPMILRHIGETTFAHLLLPSLPIQNMSTLAFVACSHQEKNVQILRELANLSEQLNPEWQPTIEEQANHIVYTLDDCPICIGRFSQTPICHVYAGVLTEAVRFATGHLPSVEETECVAMGYPACRFEIRDRISRTIELGSNESILEPARTGS
ncbi:MAG: hypothetical protein HZB51_13145 [Chloroflexi bacterium]|nr:hypothetical protein [Chloroflexota bacterium]